MIDKRQIGDGVFLWNLPVNHIFCGDGLQQPLTDKIGRDLSFRSGNVKHAKICDFLEGASCRRKLLATWKAHQFESDTPTFLGSMWKESAPGWRLQCRMKLVGQRTIEVKHMERHFTPVMLFLCNLKWGNHGKTIKICRAVWWLRQGPPDDLKWRPGKGTAERAIEKGIGCGNSKETPGKMSYLPQIKHGRLGNPQTKWRSGTNIYKWMEQEDETVDRLCTEAITCSGICGCGEGGHHFKKLWLHGQLLHASADSRIGKVARKNNTVSKKSHKLTPQTCGSWNNFHLQELTRACCTLWVAIFVTRCCTLRCRVP